MHEPLPLLSDHELRLHAQGITRVAGVDEAGRGPLAGPVVAAAVILPKVLSPQSNSSTNPSNWMDMLNDSKKLTGRRRDILFEQITAQCHFGVGIVDNTVIDNINVRQATWQAMQIAVARLRDNYPEIQYVLIDGLPFGAAPWPYISVVRGDACVRSIAAASIIAKVTRDRIMAEEDARYPQYGFARHKGYGTRAHLEAIETHGPCPIHRRSFAPMKFKNSSC